MGEEDAEHGDLLQEEEGVEELAARGDRIPGGEDAERREEAGEDDEPHAEAVDAEVVVNLGAGNPEGVLDEAEGLLRAKGAADVRCSVRTKVMSVTTRAAAGCSLPRSGSSARRSAPTSGVKTMNERIEWSKLCIWARSFL